MSADAMQDFMSRPSIGEVLAAIRSVDVKLAAERRVRAEIEAAVKKLFDEKRK